MGDSEVVYEEIEIKQEEVYEPNWNNWTANKSGPEDKDKTCGEILVSSHGKFTFVCVLCTGNFETLRSFGWHIHEQHMNFQMDFDTTDETSFVETFSSSSAEIGSPQPNDETKKLKIGLVTDAKVNVSPMPKISKYPHSCSTQIVNETATSNSETAHTDRRIYVCPYCPKTFYNSRCRQSHINIHTGERKYKCTLCPKVFTDARYLDMHVRSHLGIKKYACTYCDKRFVQPNEKTLHERTHTGEKPFQCELCAKCFISQVRLTEHIKRHKNNKNHKCDGCSMAFLTLPSLKRHKIIH